MPLECFNGKRGKHNAAPPLVRLWLCFLESLARQLTRNPRENTAYLQRPPLQVEVLPLERKQLTTSHPGGQGEDEQRFQPMSMCDYEKLTNLLHGEGLNFKTLSPGR